MPRNDQDGEGTARKRRRQEQDTDHVTKKSKSTRRKIACQPCRVRKIKCDAVRPTCGLCLASSSVCRYTDPLPGKLTIDSATDLLSVKLDRLRNDIGQLGSLLKRPSVAGLNDFPVIERRHSGSHSDHPGQPAASYIAEPSKDFLAIPAARTSCDKVLTWPIFEGKYPENALIEVLFVPDETSQMAAPPGSADTLTVPGGLLPPLEESIPLLVDRFLENVHTKNPVLDVEELVRQSRIVAVNGLGWDAWSCLILLASALGTIAKPFEAAMNVVPRSSDFSRKSDETSWAADAPTTPRALQQAESCFVLACRRLGCLKHSIVGSQCYFFAGVYLMYTLRPLLSWQYFTQSSIIYQLYMKSTHRLATDLSLLGHIPVRPNDTPDSKLNRLEESMYWSCFKSESEFRVELPLPQTELATYYHPQMFPSPPSPPDLPEERDSLGLPGLEESIPNVNDLTRTSSNLSEASSLRQHAKQLCNEEESWYYYLTEIALRRIGNRIINTFFSRDHMAWLNIKPWLSIALEFDTQVSAWSAHLPAAMQRWETNDTIRAPIPTSQSDGSNNHVSRELSWATDNRLLEMRSWLYKPFLYYFIHHAAIPRHTQSTASEHIPPSPADKTPPPTLDDFMASASLWSETLTAEEAAMLYHFITSGIECNLKILDVRSLRHRHHGLWYDMRSLMCAALILLAIVKSGLQHWIPGGAEVFWGCEAETNHPSTRHIGGRVGHVLDEFDFWSAESPDLVRHRDVLVEVTEMVRRMWSERRGG